MSLKATNDRHDVRLVKNQINPRPEDWARDTCFLNATRNVKGETDGDHHIRSLWKLLTTTGRATERERWTKRYPVPPVVGSSAVSTSAASNALPHGNGGGDTTPSVKGRPASSSGSVKSSGRYPPPSVLCSQDTETSLEARWNREEEEYQRQQEELGDMTSAFEKEVDSLIQGQLEGQFDPAFLKMTIHPDQAEEGAALLQRGRAVYRSSEGLELRKRIAEFKGGSGNREPELSKLQASLLNLVSRAMVGDSYRNLHHEHGDRNIKYSTMPFGNAFPHIRPDIFTLKESRADLASVQPSAMEFCATGSTRNARSQDRGRDNSDQLARYALTCVRDTPIAGTVYGFTACGPLFRLWCYDPLCYSSGLPCDVSPDNDDQDHIDDFLLMVALLCGPLDVLICHWKPRDQAFLAFRDDPDDLESEPLQITNWKSSDSNRPHGAVFVREQLIGRRSTAFAGKGTIDGKEKDLVIKLSYLSKDLCRHEQRVTRHIRKFAFEKLLKEGLDKSSDLTISPEDAEELRRGYSRLPQYVGTVDFSNYAAGKITHTNPRTGRAETLYLSGLVTEGRAGKVLAYNASVKDTIDVYADAARCIWASTLCNVYYRDPNQGNILQHPDGGGMLIDFGNAALQGIPDSPIVSDEDQLADVARSANAYFICLAAIRAGELVDRLDKARKAFVTEDAKERNETVNSSQLSGAVETNDWLVGAKHNDLEEAEQAIDEFRHPRYYDDLESLSYCLVHQLGRQAAPPGTEKTNIADKLCLPDQKQTLWKDGALSTLLGEMRLHAYTQVAIKSMARSVQKMDKEFLRR